MLKEWRTFERTADGTLMVSDNGEVLYTPKIGEERHLKRQFVKSAFGYRCVVNFNGKQYDIFDIMLRVFYPDRKGFAYPRNGKRQLCSLYDMVVLPVQAIPYDLEDVYVAYYLHGDREIVTAANNLDEFAKNVAEAIGGSLNYTERIVHKFFSSTKAQQPIPDEMFLTLKCSDEDKPYKYFGQLNAYTFTFLRAYERTGEQGKQIIRRFIEAAPNNDIRTYLRWLYTMRCTHAETAAAMDMNPELVKFSVRRTAVEWVSQRLDENPNLITLILF